MKKILVLGAGQSSPYLISYLLKQSEKHDWFITVCDRDYELAQSRVNGYSKGAAIEFDVNDEKMRHAQIKKADVVVNFLAPTFQHLIALDCLNFGKHCVSASYENVKVAELNKDAVRKGVLILNEMGLDPGIDHMTAMKIIQKIREKGGYISSFISYGSGLPAPEVKSNPLNYCITWNPRNVVMAGESGAIYREKGKIKILSHPQVFRRTWRVDVEGLGSFEAYPNRDSLIYEKIFNLKNVDTMIRGTLRYFGWSETWNQLVKLGVTNENMHLQNLNDFTYAEFTEMFLPLTAAGAGLEPKLANYLGINPTGKIMENLRWLGLFSDEKISGNVKTPTDVMINLLKKKMPLPKGARDLVALIHQIIAYYPKENKKEKVTATFIEYGEPNGYTAISKTVGLPAAIAVKLILTEQLPLTGCHIPTHPLIYNSVLDELKKLGLKFNEKVEVLS